MSSSSESSSESSSGSSSESSASRSSNGAAGAAQAYISAISRTTALGVGSPSLAAKSSSENALETAGRKYDASSQPSRDDTSGSSSSKRSGMSDQTSSSKKSDSYSRSNSRRSRSYSAGSKSRESSRSWSSNRRSRRLGDDDSAQGSGSYSGKSSSNYPSRTPSDSESHGSPVHDRLSPGSGRSSSHTSRRSQSLPSTSSRADFEDENVSAVSRRGSRGNEPSSRSGPDSDHSKSYGSAQSAHSPQHESKESLKSSYASARSKQSGPEHEIPTNSPSFSPEPISIDASARPQLPQSPQISPQSSYQSTPNIPHSPRVSTPSSREEHETPDVRPSIFEQNHTSDTSGASPSEDDRHEEPKTKTDSAVTQPLSVLQRLEARRRALQAATEASPQGSGENGASPKGSDEIGASPEGSDEIGVSPKGSGENGVLPKGSDEIGASPEGSDEIGVSPKGSGEIGASPKGSGENHATEIKDEQQPERNESDEGSSKRDVPVEVVELTHVDDASSKTDDDLRADEKEEWKVLIQRSALAKTKSSDVDINLDAKDGKGWMPPALTTYGENMYSAEDEHVDHPRLEPPSSTYHSGLQFQQQRPVTASPHPVTAAKEIASMPIIEIVVTAPAEDESSLGSMGYIFPKTAVVPPNTEPVDGIKNLTLALPPPEDESSPGPMGYPFPKTAGVPPNTEPIDAIQNLTPTSTALNREPQLILHRMKPTVAGIDYDYYRSWILPGVRPPPRPKSTVIMEHDRSDPPGDTAEFKPARTVKTAYTPPDLQPIREVVKKSLPSGPDSRGPTPSDTWAPSRPETDHLGGRPADEWERWKLARIKGEEITSDSSTKRSTRSYASSLSDWAPPGNLRPSSDSSKTRNIERDSSMGTWIPPTRVSRLDFAGEMSSQPSTTTQSRKAYKDPSMITIGDESSSASSSYTGRSRTQAVSPRNAIPLSKAQKVEPVKKHLGGVPSLSSSSESSSGSSEDTSALFEAQNKRPETSASATSESRRSDVEQGSIPTKEPVEPKEVTRAFGRTALCMCVLLGFLAVAGSITAAVLLIGDFLPSREKSHTDPMVAATFPPTVSYTTAPVGTIPVAAPTLPPVLLDPPTPSTAPAIPPALPSGNDDLSSDPLYELITTRYSAGAAALADPTSPQRMAFEWLRSSDNSQITSTLEQLQRYALASLYYSTNGEAWESSNAWLSSVGECSWSTTAASGSMCDSDGNLVELTLENNNLKGELPGELILLWNSLEVINLKGNDISGSIPTSIAGLGKLEHLNLASNSLYGVIPSEIGSMGNLLRLELADNTLSSTIPSALGSLSELELLDLGSNQLTGGIPTTLANIQNLAGLLLYKNFLSGAIPSELATLANLQLVYLDDNDLSGSVPGGLCALELNEFWSDCQEIQCTCCTTCCSDGVGCS